MPQSLLRNYVLKTLAAEDFALLQPSMHHVVLDIKARLEDANRPIQHVYFPEAGIASVVAAMSGGRQSEVGLIGHDGMTGVAVILGRDSSPNETYIQVASDGWCLPAAKLRAVLSESATLRESLLRYAHAFLIQSSRTALVNGHSKLEERLARWLLMVHDRVEGDKIYLTHEFLATMLGTRRPGVTTSLQMLEYRGLIHARRGEITIVDRPGMIKLTSGAYGEEEQRHFGTALPNVRTQPGVAAKSGRV
ncbi:cyclic nucleotide-binding protein [Mesorhizobium sp. SARCC-RB16n]|uniref:Crp/Fnr family transcriptional regulator n=1 Tax=Mesorhizobium sp. SARCC-RB16n TaxID=2116687 RepID=UPI00122EED5A|nr:Crp/Fnr family transcriptional regulator [Mesorhizobium sp. SARCC-RB16n]KAA3448603.1 cyclic nucleotide-binding protein [Mesorhizobium sp. SARCC-RB16n]